MNNHLDEMKFFLEVVEAYSTNIILENKNMSNNLINESNNASSDSDDNLKLEAVFKDLCNLKETLLSINSIDDNPVFCEGFEQGLYKAAEMLENLASSKYGRRI